VHPCSDPCGQNVRVPASQDIRPGDVIAFWREAGPSRWFRKDEAFDREFRDRFLSLHEAASRGDLDHIEDWQRTAEGALALCILLDQFPRNAFRGTPRMFATDAKALDVARAALRSGFDAQVDGDLRQFFYLPFMHSEQLADQDLCVEFTSRIGEDSARYARMHRDIIARFGRFPHRNAVLGRVTTPEEQRFLDEGGFSG
jgi:uncharacterized protein (DUF924 family)